MDHMTFDPNDFSYMTQPRRTCISNANGITYPIIGAGTMSLSLSFSLCLSHMLLVPSLLNKLKYVSQVIEELHYTVLIYHTFCLLQGIPNKEIIRCDAKRGDCIT